MNWFNNLLTRWRLAREARHKAEMIRLANRDVSYQWLLVKAGTSEYSRSPMITENEIREWFRDTFESRQIVHIDQELHVLFYE